MRWPDGLLAVLAAIEEHADAVTILGPAETQALYMDTQVRTYTVPSLDYLFVGATKEEVSEPWMLQLGGHATSIADLLTIGEMLEDLFDRDTWHTLGGIYMRSTKVEDGPLLGPDRHGVFHQSWDYEFEAVRDKYVMPLSAES